MPNFLDYLPIVGPARAAEKGAQADQRVADYYENLRRQIEELETPDLTISGRNARADPYLQGVEREMLDELRQTAMEGGLSAQDRAMFEELEERQRRETQSSLATMLTSGRMVPGQSTAATLGNIQAAADRARTAGTEKAGIATEQKQMLQGLVSQLAGQQRAQGFGEQLSRFNQDVAKKNLLAQGYAQMLSKLQAAGGAGGTAAGVRAGAEKTSAAVPAMVGQGVVDLGIGAARLAMGDPGGVASVSAGLGATPSSQPRVPPQSPYAAGGLVDPWATAPTRKPRYGGV